MSLLEGWSVPTSISLLERLMAMELYSKEYDKRCITKLLKNFRSHKELLTILCRALFKWL